MIKTKSMDYAKAIFILVCAFLFVFTLGLMAEAQEMNSDGELELAITTLIDAVKIGQMGLIITAFIQLLRTRMVTTFIFWLVAKLSGKKQELAQLPEVPATDVPSIAEHAGSALTEHLKSEVSKLPGAVIPSATVVAGGLAGIAESVATGKPLGQAVFEGLLSSGASMALYDLVLKPLVNKLKKK